MSSDRWRESHRAWKRLGAWFDDEVTAPGSRDREPDPLAALGDIGAVRRALDDVEMRAVRSARLRRSSWAEIATRLGVTRQAAWEKWRDFDEDVTPPTEPARPAPVDVTDADITRVIGRLGRSRMVVVPNVVGLPLHEATRTLTGFGLRAVGHDPGLALEKQFRPESQVVDQSPGSGAAVARGTRVTLWVDRGEGGVREPRDPGPSPLTARKFLDEPVELLSDTADEAVG